MQENHRSVASCPQPGMRPATQTCALTGNWTGNFSVCRPALNSLSHTNQGQFTLICWPCITTLLKKTIMSLANRDSFISFFQILLFPFLAYLLCWSELFNIVLKVVRVDRPPCFAPDIKGKATWSFTLKYNVICGFFCFCFYLFLIVFSH